jgi:hypothetical protein
MVTSAGLISALVGDDAFDVLSWFGLGMPIAVVAYYAMRK